MDCIGKDPPILLIEPATSTAFYLPKLLLGPAPDDIF